MSRDDEVERDAHHDVPRQGRIDLARGSEERGEEVTALLRLPLMEGVHEVALQRDRVPRPAKLVVEGAARLVESEPVVAPLVQALEIRLGQPEHLPDYPKRQRPGEAL